jgi:hypothetical protein
MFGRFFFSSFLVSLPIAIMILRHAAQPSIHQVETSTSSAIETLNFGEPLGSASKTV